MSTKKINFNIIKKKEITERRIFIEEKMYNFDEFINIQNTKSEKWDTLESNRSLPFTVADTDFGVPEEIIEGLKKRISHPILGYTTLEDSFYNSIAGFVKRHHNCSWKKARFILLLG